MGRKSREKKRRRAEFRRSGTGGVAGEEKMSEVLVDVVAPLLRDMSPSSGPDNYQALLLLGAALWNASRPGSSFGTEAAKQRIFTEIRSLTPRGDRSEVERLCSGVIERAKLLYPDTARLIVGVEVAVGIDDRLHVNVTSVDMPPHAGQGEPPTRA